MFCTTAVSVSNFTNTATCQALNYCTAIYMGMDRATVEWRFETKNK
jgi:hypothetical protein